MDNLCNCLSNPCSCFPKTEFNFISWFFDTPTAIIAIVSALIAGLAYWNQRRTARKLNASKIAQKYACEIIPRIRYINQILVSIGAQKFINGFGEFSDFSISEVESQLKHVNSSPESFLSTFKKINLKTLEHAFAHSGCSPYILQHHECLVYAFKNDPNSINEAFRKFVFDLLNDLEAFAIMFRFNIAEEALVYPTLHQTFLRNMPNWYFFISYRNQIDHDRYYANIIWLYKKWNKHKLKRKKHFERISWKEISKKL